MKNYYANGYALHGVRDGHDWGPPSQYAWDGAKCRDCGIEASNASIARGQFTHNDESLPACTVPIDSAEREA